jgi:hypothetical protein
MNARIVCHHNTRIHWLDFHALPCEFDPAYLQRSVDRSIGSMHTAADVVK